MFSHREFFANKQVWFVSPIPYRLLLIIIAVFDTRGSRYLLVKGPEMSSTNALFLVSDRIKQIYEGLPFGLPTLG